jgi:hypothetical protein
MRVRQTLATRRRTTIAVAVASTAVLLGSLALSESGPVAAGATVAAHKLPPHLKTPKEKKAIEGFAPDQAQFFCRNKVEPGVKSFEKRTLKQYPSSQSDGDLRACDDGGTSEHKDGRAWDWGVDHRVKKQRKDGKSMLKWLFATDSHGNQDAMFRRLGLMYIIWNKQIWGAWSQQWEPYACHGATACHVNHMHFSFGWAGAEKKTSYWTGKVSPVVEPPLHHLTKIGKHRTFKVKAKVGSATAMWLLDGNDRYQITAKGIWHHNSASSAKADAECTKTSHGWRPTTDGGVTIGGDWIQSWGQVWKPQHNNGHGCDTKDHAYRLKTTPSTLTTLSADLPDGSRGNDSGSVHLHVVRKH